jgi:hypothetical protein
VLPQNLPGEEVNEGFARLGGCTPRGARASKIPIGPAVRAFQTRSSEKDTATFVVEGVETTGRLDECIPCS